MRKLDTKRLVIIIFVLTGFETKIPAQVRDPEPEVKNHEKIYIHFDRPGYAAGETAWFKAYLYNSDKPSAISNELFLQLEDEKGKVITKKKYLIAGATVAGSINFADTLSQGNYILKAITKAILADDPRFFYTRTICLFNPDRLRNQTIAKKNVSLQFFAESGHLIDRIKTQVAFKAVDETGAPVAVNGVIKSDSTTVLTSFASTHDGIGKVSFTPHVGDALIAEVIFSGSKYQFPLPLIEPAGIYLKIAEADSGKTFLITRSRTDQQLFDTVKLIAKMKNDTVFEQSISFGNELSLGGILNTKNLSSGILHFIVLNKKGFPMAERLSFIDNNEYLLQPEFVVVKSDSSKRGRNSFILRFNDTLQRSLSIAVTDLQAQEYPDKESICSRLLLTSDLKGYVYNPAYYFEKDDAVHREALDNLMLTHGWTRYNWQTTVMGGFKPLFKDRFLLSIEGILKEQANGKAVSDGFLNMTIIAEDSSFHSLEVLVDRQGRFSIDSLLFLGNAKVYYNYTSASGRSIPVNLYIDNDSSESFFPSIKKEFFDYVKENAASNPQVPVPASPGISFEGKYKQLGAVFLKTKIKRPEDRVNEKYASPLYRSSGKLILDNINKPFPDKSLDVVNFSLMNIYNLAFDKDLNSLVNKKNISLQTMKNWVVEILLDEVVSNIEYAGTITMDKVAMIKFYESGFVGVSSQAPGGALAIYLKKTDDQQPAENNAKKYFVIAGYDVTQDFYSPDYTAQGKAGLSPDNRLTLYWNSNASASKDIRFSFYNNDFSKKLSIIAEGFDSRGRLIHFEKIVNE